MTERARKLAGRIAPIATAAALIAVFLSGGVTATPTASVQPYFDRVAAAIDETPHKVGRWIGADIEVQPAAVRLLKPNRLLQRRYVDPSSGETVQLLMVHCGETRDMVGHYPPVCYPGRGWTLEESRSVRITEGALDASAREYRFRRVVGGADEGMFVINFFVLPGADSPLADDIQSVNAASESPRRAVLGAAQVQLLTDVSMPVERRNEVVNQFVGAIADTIREIAAGQNDGT